MATPWNGKTVRLLLLDGTAGTIRVVADGAAGDVEDVLAFDVMYERPLAAMGTGTGAGARPEDVRPIRVSQPLFAAVVNSYGHPEDRAMERCDAELRIIHGIVSAL